MDEVIDASDYYDYYGLLWLIADLNALRQQFD